MMRAIRLPRMKPSRPTRVRLQAQRGVVLVVALIVLVAMSLGGIGILRSVDTSTLIAGNIAFKQRTLQATDAGLEVAIKWISDNRTNLNADKPADAYYSSITGGGSGLTNRFAWENPASWASAKLVGTDAAGNTVHYVIHRMCALPGQAKDAPGQMCGTDRGNTGSSGTISAPSEGSSMASGASAYSSPPKLYLRVTVRSSGPRNAVSYVQAMILIPA